MSINVKVFWVNVLLTLPSCSTSSANILRNAPCDGLPNEILTVNSRGCKYFFYCRNGDAIEGFCPNNLWFNFDAGICDHPKNVYCDFDDNELNTNEHTEEYEANVSCSLAIDSQEIKFVHSKMNCGRYYICYHGQAIKQQCTDDLQWNAIHNKCDQPSNVHCQTALPKPPLQSICSESKDKFMPHPSECEYFIFCKDGIASIQQCPFYHMWDIVTESCKWKHRALCNSK